MYQMNKYPVDFPYDNIYFLHKGTRSKGGLAMHYNGSIYGLVDACIDE